jgi:hypothetical protein
VLDWLVVATARRDARQGLAVRGSRPSSYSARGPRDVSTEQNMPKTAAGRLAGALSGNVVPPRSPVRWNVAVSLTLKNKTKRHRNRDDSPFSGPELGSRYRETSNDTEFPGLPNGSEGIFRCPDLHSYIGT